MTGTVARVDPDTAHRLESAALYSPLSLAMWARPRHYNVRAHHRLISRAWADMAEGHNERLLITCPPQVGKSELSSVYGPAWWLLKHPERRLVLGTYADHLAQEKGREVRAVLAEHGRRFGTGLRRGSASVTDWRTEQGGGMRSVGVGGSLTGFPANCVAGDVYIDVPSGRVPIGQYVESGSTASVLAYDHHAQRPVWARVTATSVSTREIVEVVTRNGHTIRCTEDHRFYIPGRGYVPAVELTPGTPLLAGNPGGSLLRPLRGDLPQVPERGSAPQEGAGDVLLPGVRERVQEGEQAVPGVRTTHTRPSLGVLLPAVPGAALHRDTDVPAVHAGVLDAPGRSPQADSAEHRGPADHVLESVHGRAVRGREPQGVPGVREPAAAGEGFGLLLDRVQGDRCSPAAPADSARGRMSALRDRLPAEEFEAGVLLTPVRERGACAADDRPGELALQRRRVVREAVPLDAPAGHGTRQPAVCGVQGARVVQDRGAPGQGTPSNDVPRAPHQRGPQGQQAAEPRDLVRQLPCSAPQVEHDAVAVVRPVRGGRVRVYDLQVEGTSNFFAGSVLVHNCAIVDDPHKDREHADSKVMRARVWKWWSSVLTSRLAPGASACLIMTRWHPQDLAGLLLDREGRIEQGGRWRVLELPAYAVEGDPLGRTPGDPLPHPLIAEDDVAGARAHWEAQRASTTIPRDWSSLYMCSPTAGEGALVPASLLAERRVPFGYVLPRAVQRAVAVDPSGGGKDEAGIVAGFAGLDHRLYLTHDWSGRMSSDEWARKACLLAFETGADMIVVEKNYGGDMPRRMINLAWRSLAQEGRVRGRHAPYVVEVTARQGKHIRAEPMAQMFVEDLARLVRPLPELELEWSTWSPSMTGVSPGRLDASVYLGLKLVPYISPEPGR